MALHVCRRLSVQDVRRVVDPVLGEACSTIMVRRGVEVLVSGDANDADDVRDDDNENRVSEEAATNGNDGMNCALASKILSLPISLPAIVLFSRGKRS